MFDKKTAEELKKTLGVKNVMAIPRITKVTINVGIGTYIKSHNKDFSNIVENITAITGQKPVITKAKKAVSNFKLRENEPVGISVTLRKKRMEDFVTKLVKIVFPRTRDFRGLSPKAFDGKGNYSIGFKEHTVFPEISPDDVMKLHGLQVNIITSAKTDEEGYELLKALGFPFKKLAK
jgi:large subunit ribosomal protein L5